MARMGDIKLAIWRKMLAATFQHFATGKGEIFIEKI